MVWTGTASQSVSSVFGWWCLSVSCLFAGDLRQGFEGKLGRGGGEEVDCFAHRAPRARRKWGIGCCVGRVDGWGATRNVVMRCRRRLCLCEWTARRGGASRSCEKKWRACRLWSSEVTRGFECGPSSKLFQPQMERGLSRDFELRASVGYEFGVSKGILNRRESWVRVPIDEWLPAADVMWCNSASCRGCREVEKGTGILAMTKTCGGCVRARWPRRWAG